MFTSEQSWSTSDGASHLLCRLGSSQPLTSRVILLVSHLQLFMFLLLLYLLINSNPYVMKDVLHHGLVLPSVLQNSRQDANFIVRRAISKLSLKSRCLQLNVISRYKIALDSDAVEFGGHRRLDPNCEYLVDSQPWHDRPFSLLVSSLTK